MSTFRSAFLDFMNLILKSNLNILLFCNKIIVGRYERKSDNAFTEGMMQADKRNGGVLILIPAIDVNKTTLRNGSKPRYCPRFAKKGYTKIPHNNTRRMS
jgi:hypothetical protein